MPQPLTIHPLTANRWPDFVRLFGEQGVGGGCWCMYWRIGRDRYRREKGEANKRTMRLLVQNDEVPGLLAYVRSQGGRIVEAYPVPPKPSVASTAYAYPGFLSSFEKAGFRECARRRATRPIVRYEIERSIERKKTDRVTARGRRDL